MQIANAYDLNNMQEGEYDIPNDDYHASNGVSRSGIVQLCRSPKHYWERYINPEREKPEPTPALIIGSAFHTLVLEPDLFNDSFIVYQKPDKLPPTLRLKDVGRELFEINKFNIEQAKRDRDNYEIDFEILSRNKMILTIEQYDTVQRMRDSVMSDPEASQLLAGAQYERSLYFKDDASGELCKVRPDFMHPHFAGDLKSSVDASEGAFQRALYDYGYFLQGSMISDGIEKIKNKVIEEFVFILCEKEPPYAVVCYPVCYDTIEYGKKKYRAELLKLAECRKNNSWPSYPSKVITLPHWAMNE